MKDEDPSNEIRRLDRRRFLTGAATLGTTAAVGDGRGRAATQGNLPPHVPAWMSHQGTPLRPQSYGIPSAFERDVVRRIRNAPPIAVPVSTGTPLQDLHGIITPSGLHFERHHAGVPGINPDEHRLLIHGLVQRPLLLSVDDLLRLPSVSRIHFLECAGNTGTNWKKGDPRWTVQDTHGLISCSEWTGVELSTLLAEVGLKPEARWILAEGADAAAMTRSIPIEKALDDAIIAYAQNGERLRPEQGYPLRLLVPGFEGNMNVKWLRRLKLGDQPFQTHEETARYTELMPDGTALQFNFLMETKSVITFPSGGNQLRGPGYYEIRGLAWSGCGRIKRVEVTIDGGATWQQAELQEPVLTKCLTRFRLGWRWEGAPALLQSRALDETGHVQPSRAELIAARGTNWGYHFNGVQSWRIDATGAVSNEA